MIFIIDNLSKKREKGLLYQKDDLKGQIVLLESYF